MWYWLREGVLLKLFTLSTICPIQSLLQVSDPVFSHYVSLLVISTPSTILHPSPSSVYKFQYFPMLRTVREASLFFNLSLSMHIQGSSPLEITGLNSLQVKGIFEIFQHIDSKTSIFHTHAPLMADITFRKSISQDAQKCPVTCWDFPRPFENSRHLKFPSFQWDSDAQSWRGARGGWNSFLVWQH